MKSDRGTQLANPDCDSTVRHPQSVQRCLCLRRLQVVVLFCLRCSGLPCGFCCVQWIRWLFYVPPVLGMDNNIVQNKVYSVLTEEITPPRISTRRSSEHQIKTLIVGLSATTNQIMCLLSVKCDEITSTKSPSFCMTTLSARRTYLSHTIAAAT